MLLKTILTVNRLTVGVLTSPRKLVCRPSTVILERLNSSFHGWTLHAVLVFVTSFQRLFGIWWLWMKFMVLGTSFRPGMPWHRRPVFLPKEHSRSVLCFHCLKRWQHFRSSPVSPSGTALARLMIKFIGYLRDAVVRSESDTLAMSNTWRSFFWRVTCLVYMPSLVPISPSSFLMMLLHLLSSVLVVGCSTSSDGDVPMSPLISCVFSGLIQERSGS